MYADFPSKPSKAKRWMKSITARIRRQFSKKAKEAHSVKLEIEGKQYGRNCKK